MGGDFTLALAAELRWQLVGDRIKGSALARGFGLTQSSVSNWLNGVSPMPLGFAYAACSVMGAEFPDLLDLAEKRQMERTSLLTTGDLNRSRPRAAIEPDTYSRGESFADFLAAELKSQIRSRGLSLRKIGKATGHSPSLIGIWVNGKRPVPLPFVYNACTAMDVSIRDLSAWAEARMIDLDAALPDTPPQPSDGLSTNNESEVDLASGHVDDVDDLSQIAADRGVLRLAARGDLSPEALREIAAVIKRHIPEQDS